MDEIQRLQDELDAIREVLWHYKERLSTAYYEPGIYPSDVTMKAIDTHVEKSLTHLTFAVEGLSEAWKQYARERNEGKR